MVEGAAGAGKTKTLSATQELLAERGHRMVVVTPTLKAAKVAGRETGTKAFSAAWLAHQHGWRWDEDGRWTREAATPVADAVLQRGDLLLIDEAGMLDQDTARAILTLADETQARVALVGDRHQLPAVGRGGVLDLAARWARPETVVPLDVVHRFTDPRVRRPLPGDAYRGTGRRGVRRPGGGVPGTALPHRGRAHAGTRRPRRHQRV